MAASSAAPTRTNRDDDRDRERHVPVTKSTETKAAFKTTEMIAYVVVAGRTNATKWAVARARLIGRLGAVVGGVGLAAA